MDRLILHHLKLYSDPKLLIIVINTTTQDEVKEYFVFFKCLTYVCDILTSIFVDIFDRATAPGKCGIRPKIDHGRYVIKR